MVNHRVLVLDDLLEDRPAQTHYTSMKKYLLLAALAATSLQADEVTKSYVELQRERMAKADAAYQRFRQEQDAAQLSKLAADKAAIEERARRKEADRAYRRQLSIAAASAPRINVHVNNPW
jgi:hypothetical protein